LNDLHFISTPKYYLFFLNFSLNFTNKFLAHINSEASIASPIGITISAGPGTKIRIIPIIRIVKPTIPTISFLIPLNVLWINLI